MIFSFACSSFFSLSIVAVCLSLHIFVSFSIFVGGVGSSLRGQRSIAGHSFLTHRVQLLPRPARETTSGNEEEDDDEDASFTLFLSFFISPFVFLIRTVIFVFSSLSLSHALVLAFLLVLCF